MRNAFISVILEEAQKNEDIFFLTGDLGYSVIEEYVRRFPDRFLNVGVAEQNMMGIAAGIASTGKTVFVYSIGNFPTLRCLEQIRNDVCYHNFNVKIVSVGTGLHYGALASSHHATEDLAILRSLPNMIILAPADPLESELATRALIARPGPCYLRLCQEKPIHQQLPSFEIGKAIMLRDGTDVSLFSIGGMLRIALQSADILSTYGVSAQVISVHTLKPLDEECIIQAAKKTKRVVTIEEHTIHGGLGGAIAETLMKQNLSTTVFKNFGINDRFPDKYGGRDFLRAQYGLSPEAIAESVRLACV